MRGEPRFIVDDPDDAIQQSLTQGRYYEQDELDRLSKYVKPGWVIVDVGANVGNHTIYFDRHFSPKVVYAIEPIPRAYKLLLQNVALNYAHSVNVDHIGLALGDQNTKASVETIFHHNLGATILKVNPAGDIAVKTGDSLFGNLRVDLLKIDVEKMEMQVLRGLEQTIQNSKPMLFIEVDIENRQDFTRWCLEHRYQIKEITREHPHNANFIVCYEG